jgi:hypothetical protein
VARDDDFRLVVLVEPPQGVISPPPGVAVSAPAGPLRANRRLREAAVAYEAGRRPDLAIPPAALESLGQGRLFASAPLQVRPEEIYHKGKARLDLLARDLLAAQAFARRLEAIAFALSAPEPTRPATRERLDEFSQLMRDASDIVPAEGMPEALEALARLSELVYAPDTEEFLACAERIYPNDRALMEDIYLLRAFKSSPAQAAELLSMRRFLYGAHVPAGEQDLSLDKSLAAERSPS